VVTFSHAVQHFYPAALAVTYPFVVSGLHVSYGELGVVVGAAGVVGGLLQVAAGFFEAVSARLLLALQNVGLAVATALGAAAPSFAVFGAARCLGAVVSWPQHPVGAAVLTKRFPHRRAFALSWHVAGGSIGTVMVPLAVAAVIAKAGWRSGLGVVTLPLLAGGVLVAWRLKDPDRSSVARGPADRRRNGDAGDVGDVGVPGATGDARERDSGRDGGDPAPQVGGAGRPGGLAAFRTLLRRRDVVGALAAGTLAAGGRGLGTLTTYVPAYLRSSLHLSALAVGGVFTVVVVGSIAGPVVAGHLADRVGRRAVLVIVYLLGAVAIAAFTHVGSALAPLALVGLAVGVFAYAESPLVQAVFSERAAGTLEQTAFGLFFAVAYGVGSLWVMLVGYLVDATGFQVAFAVMAASFVAAAAIVAATGRERPVQPLPDPGPRR
jgi:MFS family permease